jgi:membrane-associated progesterone receptor component
MNTESNEITTTEKVIVLFQRLIYDIWTSPINLILVILIIVLLIKLFLLKRKPINNSTPSNIPPPLPKMVKQDLTIEQLRGYNGIESNGRILTAIYGDIFDVSRRSDLYGPGKRWFSFFFCFKLNKCLIEIGGSYSLFAGRDATRALSKMELTQSLFPNEYDELTDLTDGERATARNWHEDFRGILIYEKLNLIFFCFCFRKI